MARLAYVLGAVILLQMHNIDSAPQFPSMSPSFSPFMPSPFGNVGAVRPLPSSLDAFLTMLPLIRQIPPYILKMVIHNSNVFLYPAKRLDTSELGYLAYLCHKQGLPGFYVVYNFTSLDEPITVAPGDLPPCFDACPINADTISKPTAAQSNQDTTFIPPNASGPAPVAVPVPPSPAPIVPSPATPPPSIPPPVTNTPFNPMLIPSMNTPSAPPLVPAAAPTIPPPAPVPSVEDSGLKLSVFARNLIPSILAADYRSVRKAVEGEFTSGMEKLQTDLARLKLRKQSVVNKTSATDEKVDDLAYLDGIVGDAEKVLVDKYTDRRKQFWKDINRMVAEPAFKNITPREAAFVADRFDHLVHDPIADSKKFLNSARKDINDKMAV